MRIDLSRTSRDHRSAPLRGLAAVSTSGTLEPSLLELVKMRASQMNGCAHYLEMHTKDARAIGEANDRLHLVAVWREVPCFTPRERAALAWCEELTLISAREVPDELYDEVRQHFSEDELCGQPDDVTADGLSSSPSAVRPRVLADCVGLKLEARFARVVAAANGNVLLLRACVEVGRGDSWCDGGPGLFQFTL